MIAVNTTLREARTEAGLSQDELARRAGVSRQAYGAVESGRAVPSTEVALRLAKALRTTVEALFSLADAPARMVEAELVGDGGVATGPARVQLVRVGERLLARPLVGASWALHAMTPAEGVMGRRRTGGRAQVRVLDEEALETPTLVMAGCDPAVALLAPALRERGVRLVWTEEASRDALGALARGEAHVAGCHLLDEESGRYNAPWVGRLVPMPCTVVRYAAWRQGLIVAAGNPKGIRGVRDLARQDVRTINRQEGSGGRLLLDRLLRRYRVASRSVAGYEHAVHGHVALAEVVAAGMADAGVGVEAAARAFGLDFLPLTEERYDLVAPERFAREPAVRALMEVLSRAEVRGQVEALGGYDTTGMGQPASA